MKALIAILLLATSLQAAPVPPSLAPNPSSTPFLGITNNQVFIPNGITVDTVIKGSSADKAGIKDGDVLRQVGTIKIDNFSQLQQALRLYRPGATILVEIEREGKSKVLKVCLGERLVDLDEPTVIVEP